MESRLPKELSVNLLDPDDVEAKAREVDKRYELALAELDELQAEVNQLADMSKKLHSFAGNGQGTRAKRAAAGALRVISEAAVVSSSPAQDRIVAVVEGAGRPMKAAEVGAALGESSPEEKNRIGASMWAAERSGRLVKLGAGLYAPVGYEREQASLPTTGGSEE